ncbi:hypothetical protein DOTSEDRAFT_70854 [Dothistroma septosporum NZE10]|uniref:DUF7730 domain-containing protein n=1 Tax=Dothistroma septosporum (strain NZE10 / CBS 128990) TaxID=675120 RepID=N1PNG0_DOTSN|nr:hypothetical protein DOTSEDRAFT_70854 [Dothistroma septosporum NZE10]
MAPATSQALEAGTISSPMTPNRIFKSRSENHVSRSTRQRSRMLASASSSSMLQDMVNEAQEVVAGASGTFNGKGKARSSVAYTADSSVDHYESDVKMAEALQAEDDAKEDITEVCPITDKDTKPFPIMELPTEIRLEIYRACLTRPYNILLSKKEQPPQIEKEPETSKDITSIIDSHFSAEDTEEDAQRRSSLRSRHQRNTSAGDGTAPAARRVGLNSGVARGLVSRGARPIRLQSSRSAPGSAGGNLLPGSPAYGATQTASTGMVFRSATTRPANARRHVNTSRGTVANSTEPARNQNADPLLVNILRASRDIYKEARSVLYNENIFNLDLNTAMPTLACLHQRSRRQIKHIELEIPTYNEILERFQETVRLSLRYCTGLKKIVIHMPFTLPGADGSGTTGNTTVYANGFDILRWLPQECNVILQGNICSEILTVVNKHLHLAKTLDKLAYARRQLISNDTGGSSSNSGS